MNSSNQHAEIYRVLAKDILVNRLGLETNNTNIGDLSHHLAKFEKNARQYQQANNEARHASD